jgi:hypothetical protein
MKAARAISQPLDPRLGEGGERRFVQVDFPLARAARLMVRRRGHDDHQATPPDRQAGGRLANQGHVGVSEENIGTPAEEPRCPRKRPQAAFEIRERVASAVPNIDIEIDEAVADDDTDAQIRAQVVPAANCLRVARCPVGPPGVLHPDPVKRHERPLVLNWNDPQAELGVLQGRLRGSSCRIVPRVG